MTYEQNLEALEQYRERLGDKQTDFLAALWKIQDECEPEVTWDAGDRETMLKRLNKNKNLLSFNTPQMDVEWFVDTLGKIRDLIRENARDKDSSIFLADLSTIKQSDLKDGVIYVDNAVKRINKRLNVTHQSDENGMLALAIVSTIRTFARACARNVDTAWFLDYGFPETPTCPICGSSAALGIVRPKVTVDGGQRHLYCAHCDTTWHYPRIKCSYCGSVDPDGLRYFFSTEDPAHQMHVCKKCETAVPSMQLIEFKGLFSPMVEEAVTLPLAYSVMNSKPVQDFLNDK